MTRIVAPAKLTVSLAVTGVRPDGFHELRSEMVSLSLSDELVFNEAETGLTVIADPGTRAEQMGADEDNLITRALSAVGRRAGVEVTKRIPLGGGLGGGSTDAAAVLRWAGCTDPNVALSLGSDVPFSVIGGRALVEATGEKVSPLDFVFRQFLLLIPPFGVNTAKVYAAWDDLDDGQEPADEVNALTAAALAVEPRLTHWRDALGDLAGDTPTLAGSGSTWFVEVSAAQADTDYPSWLAHHEERSRLIVAHTVPAGWDGS